MQVRQADRTHLLLARAEPRAGHRVTGGASGNARLTSLAGAVLLVLLAVEGATIPALSSLLNVHVFVGMLLLGPVALKLAVTGYRMSSYYIGRGEYVKRGPPTPLLRLVVAPVLVLSTLTLFGTGVGLLLVPHRGLLGGLHKASFIVWFGATSIHVLAHLPKVGRHLLGELSGNTPRGRRLRLVAIGLAVVGGVLVAVATYPLAAPWLHQRFG